MEKELLGLSPGKSECDMKTRFKVLLPLLLLVTLPTLVQAQLNYMNDNGALTITGYTGSAGAVNIPSAINFLPVTSIAYRAFFTNGSLTSVTIPNSVTNIGDAAFQFCTNLTSVTISTNIPSIGTNLFYSCTSLTNVTIPERVTSIGYEAFWNCTSLTSVTIPNSVTNIGDAAFQFCTNLTSVTIGSSVTSAENAFGYCTSLISVTISNGITTIADSMFLNCTSLTNVSIPNSVTNIGPGAFYYCTNLTSVTIGSSVTSIAESAFYACSSLTNVTIPNSVSSIGYEAFYDCYGLTGVYFQGNAPSLSVGSQVFNDDNVTSDNATIYYLPGTTGWPGFATISGKTPVLWNPQVQTSYASFGVRANQFGFTITGTANIPIVVEACVNLAKPVWSPLTNVTLTNGLFYFGDAQWTNYARRYYHLRSP